MLRRALRRLGDPLSLVGRRGRGGRGARHTRCGFTLGSARLGYSFSLSSSPRGRGLIGPSCLSFRERGGRGGFRCWSHWRCAIDQIERGRLLEPAVFALGAANSSALSADGSIRDRVSRSASRARNDHRHIGLTRGRPRYKCVVSPIATIPRFFHIGNHIPGVARPDCCVCTLSQRRGR